MLSAFKPLLSYKPSITAWASPLSAVSVCDVAVQLQAAPASGALNVIAHERGDLVVAVEVQQRGRAVARFVQGHVAGNGDGAAGFRGHQRADDRRHAGIGVRRRALQIQRAPARLRERAAAQRVADRPRKHGEVGGRVRIVVDLDRAGAAAEIDRVQEGQRAGGAYRAESERADQLRADVVAPGERVGSGMAADVDRQGAPPVEKPPPLAVSWKRRRCCPGCA